MKRRNFLLAVAAAGVAVAQAGDAKLAVEVSYTGAGTVDASHKVFVILWDTPDFIKEGSQTPPIGVESTGAKTGSVQFDRVKGPVYLSMAYDPSGKWDVASPPPAGTSLGMYTKDAATPAAIELPPGKTTKISVTFDDSYKMK